MSLFDNSGTEAKVLERKPRWLDCCLDEDEEEKTTTRASLEKELNLIARGSLLLQLADVDVESIRRIFFSFAVLCETRDRSLSPSLFSSFHHLK